MMQNILRPLSVTVLVCAVSLSLAEAGSISTSTVDGETRIKWNGEEVFKGKTEGTVRSKSSTIDGKELAAVLAGDKVVWESEPGAAEALTKASDPVPVKLRGKGLSVASVNGESVVTFEGREVWKGKTENRVSVKSKTVDGETFAAASDGEKLLWENVPGAGKKLGWVGKQPKVV